MKSVGTGGGNHHHDNRVHNGIRIWAVAGKRVNSTFTNQ